MQLAPTAATRGVRAPTPAPARAPSVAAAAAAARDGSIGSSTTRVQQHRPHAASPAAAAIAAAILLCSPGSTLAAEGPVTAAFANKCAGCHINGGNIIQAGATLFQADLVKNNAADADSLYRLIYAGKGRMPGFGQECTPKLQCTFGPRLSDEEVQQLVSYVQEQAAADWKQ